MLSPTVDLTQVGGDVHHRPTGATGNGCEGVGRFEHPCEAGDLHGKCVAVFEMMHETPMLSTVVAAVPAAASVGADVARCGRGTGHAIDAALADGDPDEEGSGRRPLAQWFR